MKQIGRSLARVEDERLLTGRGLFVDDIAPAGTLQMAVLRSTHAHARIRSIRTEAASALPGVHLIITAETLGAAGARQFPIVFPHDCVIAERNTTALAREKVRYTGEPVAAVIADDRYIAEDALELIEVEYETLPAVIDLEEAVTGTVLIHEGVARNVGGAMAQKVGDPDAAFADADHVVKARLTITRGSGQPMETRGVLAVYDRDRLTLWSGTQAPHRVRMFLSQLLGLPEGQVRVIAPDIGGAFGLKGNFYPEEFLVPWAAIQLGRPVKYIEDRRENFLATTQERSQIHWTEAAIKDGRIVALRDHFLHDYGAYNPYGMVLPQNTQNHSCGAYVIPNLDLSLEAVFTNMVPTAAYRGAGRPQGIFVVERMMDLCAREIGVDPVAFRRRHLVPADAHPYSTGLSASGRGPITYESGNYPLCQEKAVAALGYDGWRRDQAEARAQGRYLGIAVANYVEASGTVPYEGATVQIDQTGAISVHTGAAPQGQGHQTTLAQVAADVLEVEPAAVRIYTGDTDGIHYGIGTFGSRTASLVGSAVLVAARQVREKALRLAAHLLRTDVASLSWSAGGATDGDRTLSLAQLAQAAARGALPGEPPGLEATYYQSVSQASFANGTHACVIEVKPDTGAVAFLKYVVVHDCGVVINPLIVDGQVYGGFAQGLGGSLYERISYDENGQLLTGSYMDYLIPTATEVPPVEIHHVVSPNPLVPIGAKGAGEGGVMPVYALLAQAVEDALAPLGAGPITDMPLSPDLIVRLAGRLSSASTVLAR